jgi:hypothetical protein
MGRDFLPSIGFDITLGGRSLKLLSALVRKERINPSDVRKLKVGVH